MDKDEDTTNVEWSAQVEDILAGEGTASVGSSTLFGPGNSTTSGIAIGLVSIAVGILNTLGGFFNFAKRSEAHRIAHLHYSKISSKIQIELSLPRLERDSAESLLNYVRDSMERLAETTPLASERIVKDFNSHFEKLKDEIAMPPETNGLHKIKVYRSNGPVPTPKFSFDMDVPANVPDGKTAQLIAAQAQSYIDRAAGEVHINMANSYVPLNTTVKIQQPQPKVQTILIPPPSSTPQSSKARPQALPLPQSPLPSLPIPIAPQQLPQPEAIPQVIEPQPLASVPETVELQLQQPATELPTNDPPTEAPNQEGTQEVSQDIMVVDELVVREEAPQ